jgi:hypothetical protein
MRRNFPLPSTWEFPDIVQEAILICPTTRLGRRFNSIGIAYPIATLEKIDVTAYTAQALSQYADAVTHAFPDASMLASGTERYLPQQTTAWANCAYAALYSLTAECRAIAVQRLARSHLKLGLSIAE